MSHCMCSRFFRGALLFAVFTKRERALWLHQPMKKWFKWEELCLFIGSSFWELRLENHSKTCHRIFVSTRTYAGTK